MSKLSIKFKINVNIAIVCLKLRTKFEIDAKTVIVCLSLARSLTLM